MGPSGPDVITAEGLVKVYRSRSGEVRALDGLDLTVAEGSILGLLGPNGAGKTTTVRILATLLLTTQYLEEADELAHSIAVVDHGRIIARGTADELKSLVGGERIEVVVHDPADIARAMELLAREGDGECTVDEHTRRLTVPAHGGAQRLVRVVRDLDEARIAIDDVGLRRPTLDDVFLALTGHAAELAAAGEGDDAPVPAGRDSWRS